MVDVWRIAENSDDKGRLRGKDFIDGSFISAGWSIKSEKDRSSINDFSGYLDALKNEENGNLKFGKSYGPFISGFIPENQKRSSYFVKPGDYVWMLDHGLKEIDSDQWYLAKMGSVLKVEFDSAEEHNHYHKDDAARITVQEWKKIPGTALPGYIEEPSMRGFTLRRLTANSDAEMVRDITRHYFNNQNQAYSIKLGEITASEYLGLLGYSGLEDLLYYYLHFREDLKYEIIPSTNKQSKRKYEFELRGSKNGGTKIAVQVKNGGGTDLSLTNYLEDLKQKFDEIWLITRDGKIMDENKRDIGAKFIRLTKTGIIEKIDLEELFEFAKNPDNRWLLPEYMTQWIID